MGYFSIGRHKVFYSDDRFVEINKPFYATLSAHEIIAMKFLGIDGKPDANWVRFQSLQEEELTKELKFLGEEMFVRKWVYFDFRDEQAQNVSWGLLYDFLQVNAYGQINDVRDLAKRFLDDFTGEGYPVPRGEVVEIEFKLRSNRKWFARLFDASRRLTFTIDLTKVRRVNGTLSKLQMVTANQLIKMSEQIQIVSLFDSNIEVGDSVEW